MCVGRPVVDNLKAAVAALWGSGHCWCWFLGLFFGWLGVDRVGSGVLGVGGVAGAGCEGAGGGVSVKNLRGKFESRGEGVSSGSGVFLGF